MKRLLEKCMLNCKDIKLLYVEDNEEARFHSYEMFKRFFKYIVTAVDGDDALKKFKRETFDIVITDISMPKMNGIELAEEIKNLDGSVPVVIISAHNEEEYFLSSLAVGVEGYLLKPIDMTQLMSTLIRVVENINLQKQVVVYQEKLESVNIELEAKVQERTQELEYKLYHDHLTHFGNHESIMKNFDVNVCETLIMIDINGFKRLNDLYGLESGNEMLQKFSKILSAFDEYELYNMYRVYGDRFLLQYKDGEVSEKNFEIERSRLLKYFENIKVFVSEIKEYIEIDVTIGISLNEKNAFVKTDMALDYAKSEGKQMVIYSAGIDSSKKHSNDLYWKGEIKLALENNDIVPVYQAIVDNAQKIVKYETLIRLRQYKDGEAKLISPFFFLEPAVTTKQYHKLTRAVIQKSFEFMQDKEVDFSVNLSFEDFADPSRVTFLHEQLEIYNVANRVVFEILESEVVSDYRLVIDILKDFRAKGVRIAIDDFGSGYSNFEHILKLEPDYIKIDASLIKHILEDERTATLVKAIAEFSKELGMKVIAEYVENEDVFEVLNTFDIDEYQGYCFSVPAEALME